MSFALERYLQCTNNSPKDAIKGDIFTARSLACGMRKVNPNTSHDEISGRTKNARAVWVKML